jgi:hypothetical protein
MLLTKGIRLICQQGAILFKRIPDCRGASDALLC